MLSYYRNSKRGYLEYLQKKNLSQKEIDDGIVYNKLIFFLNLRFLHINLII